MPKTSVVGILLVLGSIVLGIAGCVQLTPATNGVGLIAFACLLAILARIGQADSHIEALKNWILSVRDSNQSPKP